MDKYKSKSALVSFLYELMRDHVPCGTVEKLVKDANPYNANIEFSNGYLAQYAEDLANRLINNEKLKNEHDYEHTLYEYDVVFDSPEYRSMMFIDNKKTSLDENRKIIRKYIKKLLNCYNIVVEDKNFNEHLPIVTVTITPKKAEEISKLQEIKSVYKKTDVANSLNNLLEQRVDVKLIFSLSSTYDVFYSYDLLIKTYNEKFLTIKQIDNLFKINDLKLNHSDKTIYLFVNIREDLINSFKEFKEYISCEKV